MCRVNVIVTCGGSRSSFIAFERHDFAKLRELPRQSLQICLVDYAKIARYAPSRVMSVCVNDGVGDDVLSCPGCYYCFLPTLLPSGRELELNCSRSHPVVCLREIIF